MPYMYILKCCDDSYYTGSTWNLKKRLQEHQNGEGANYTEKRRPVELVYYEYFKRIEDAYKREKQIQRWTRKKKEALMEGKFKKLHELSECANRTHYWFYKYEILIHSFWQFPFDYAQGTD
ncbi:MAG: GIY-YIG nuclease family protein [Leptospiraceae bacterium]|nr:GIY-YIG nuclease family protein [Leptospiraceae bacterium]MCP5494645.1 GIY-YIG nuclease family protein [Leptospiraceae bacterium]